MKYDVAAPYKEDIIEEIIHGAKLLLKYCHIDENEKNPVSLFFLIIQIQNAF